MSLYNYCAFAVEQVVRLFLGENALHMRKKSCSYRLQTVFGGEKQTPSGGGYRYH